MTLACFAMGLTFEEALVAATINGAASLDRARSRRQPRARQAAATRCWSTDRRSICCASTPRPIARGLQARPPGLECGRALGGAIAPIQLLPLPDSPHCPIQITNVTNHESQILHELPVHSLSIAVLDTLASPDPTPGGGSASALAGALGASLLAMVAGMPKTRSNTPEERSALDAAREDAGGLRGDTWRSSSIATPPPTISSSPPIRQPKSTDEEKAARKAAIQDAMRVATEVPLETMRACAEVLGAAKTVAEHGNRNAGERHRRRRCTSR